MDKKKALQIFVNNDFFLQVINGGTVMILKFLAQISMTLIREDISICFGRCEIEHKKNNQKRAKQCAYHIMLTQ